MVEKDPILQTFNLTKRFGEVIALDDVNIACYSGITGLLGPNGAGKTTIIKIILGLLKPTMGSAKVLGLDCQSEAATLHKRLGVCHEKPIFPNNFTAYQFLQTVCQFYEMNDSDKRIQRVLKLVNLWSHQNRRIGTFSAGMIQRIGIAQALVAKPELVFLDEPTANLDPLGRLQIIKGIQKIHEEQGTAFVISSHVLPDIERICDSIVIINEGHILLQGSLKEILGKSTTETVTVKFQNRIETSQLPEAFLSRQNTRLDSFTIRFQVSNILAFQEELFRWAIQAKIGIRQFRVDSDLEQLYTRTLAKDGG